MFKLFKINMNYIKTVNRCNMDSFKKFMTDILMTETDGSDEQVLELFTSKRYIWNLIRGKDFYKSMADYIVCLTKINAYNEADILLRCVVETTKVRPSSDDQKGDIRKHFVTQVMKRAPFLTVTTIQYMSPERLEQILELPALHELYVDTTLQPFINRIILLDSSISIAQAISELD